MEDILQDILDIKPGNKFLEYIVGRVTKTNYRGVHKSQHNRYDIIKLEKILKAMRDVAGQDEFSIPSGDIGVDADKLKSIADDHEQFHRVYQILKGQGVVSAPDPIRKNFFVEFSRMGFIEKYDGKGNLLDPFGRTHTKTIKLSDQGIAFLDAKTLFERHKIFTDGVEKLLGSALIELVSAIDLSNYRRDAFCFEEYTLIFSDEDISGTEKIMMLDEWRCLTRNEQKKALSLIKEYCTPERFDGNKSDKRDYHNWRNETQQLMGLFRSTIYFQVHDDQFSLNVGPDFGIFEVSRSEGVKSEYFNEHALEKEECYELHHIVPLSYVRNKEEYKLIDNYKNLIYLHKDKHKEIKRDYIIFKDKYPKVYFVNRFENSDVISAKNNKDAKFNPSLLPKMKKYNSEIVKSILNTK